LPPAYCDGDIIFLFKTFGNKHFFNGLLGVRVGYFVARIVNEHVLIQTFLFLTMDGTPEGTMLWERLKLSRGDKEYLGLDAIETFTDTNIRTDPQLLALLEECNCAISVIDSCHLLP